MGAVLAALDGVGPAPHPVVLAPPAAPRGAAPPPPPPDGKPVHGSRMDHHVDSRNFTVAWLGTADWQDAAEAASDAAEVALAAFTGDLGFRRPVSSDAYLLWIVLDPTLGAAGLTTEYADAGYPDGYPVIFLDPTLAADPDVWDTVVTHEVAHAVQFAYREAEFDQTEPWYWEASAEWATALARPELDVYADSSVWLAARPGDAHWSMVGLRQYGMFILNAYLAESAGEGSLREVWEAGGARPGAEWSELVAQVAGVSEDRVFGEAYAAWANRTLDESALYEPPHEAGVFEDDVAGAVGWLGAQVYRVEARGTAKARATSGGVRLASPAGAGAAVQVRPGDRVVVVGTAPGENAYVLALDPPLSGGGSDDVERDDGSSGVSGALGPEDGAGCSAAPGPPWFSPALALLAIRRRRRGSGPGASSRSG